MTWWERLMGKKEKPDFERLVLHKLGNLEKIGAKLMSQNDDITAKLDEIDATTTEIGNDIDLLIAGGLVGLSQAEADAVILRLSKHADTLKATAAKS